ncbi:MAG TPA: indole-3-glycerol phosphate synthase TrpC [Candidatus Omnitrophica bacterium]|nr:indole-3-glycerol phosphate synthase TrpC [Candidatus Omnitrophota bacterium]
MNILDEIVAYKKEQLKKLKSVTPFLEFIKALDKSMPEARFCKKIGEAGIHLIAEIKKASPSAGIIKEDFDAGDIALAYEAGGAGCLSVLTEDRYFKGSLSYLGAVASAVRLPILRKDFLIDEYHIYESKANHADAVLLITAILKEKGLKDLLAACAEVRLDALVEVHSEDELKKALDCGASIIGINTRNLKDLTIDLDILPGLISKMPADKLVVCESGIRSLADIDMIKKFKANAVLVGEALMRAKDIEAATREFAERLKK